MCLPNILFPVFMFTFIFHHHSFSPCSLLAFLILSLPLWSSMFISLFSLTHSSSFSVIHAGVYFKNNAKKDTTLFCCFSKRPRSHVSFHTCCSSHFTLVCLWCGKTVTRSIAQCMVMWLPNFLWWTDYHISLAMGLCPFHATWSGPKKSIKGRTRFQKVRDCKILSENIHEFLMWKK